MERRSPFPTNYAYFYSPVATIVGNKDPCSLPEAGGCEWRQEQLTALATVG